MCRLKQPGIKSPTLWLVDELNYIHPWCYAGILVRLCLGISLIAATNLQTVFSQVGSSKKNSIWRTELPAKAWIWCSGCKADSFTYKGYNFLYTFYLIMWKLQQFLFSLKNHWAANPMRESCLFFIGEYSVFVSSFVSYIQRFIWTVCVCVFQRHWLPLMLFSKMLFQVSWTVGPCSLSQQSWALPHFCPKSASQWYTFYTQSCTK